MSESTYRTTTSVGEIERVPSREAPASERAPQNAPEASNEQTTRERILVIAPTPYFADRGCHVRIYEETLVLQDLGHEVDLCTYHLGRDIEGIRTHRSVTVPWYRKLGPGPSYHKLYMDILLLFTCWNVARRNRSTLIHAHLHEGAFLGMILSKFLRIPCVADLQGSLTKELSDYSFAGGLKLVYRVLAWLEGIIVRAMDHIVVSSEVMEVDLVNRFRVPAERITVVKDGVGKGFFENEEPYPRSRYDIPDDHRVVAFLGVLTKLQGVDLLMDVIPRVLQDHPNVTFLIAGFPNEEHYARELESRGVAQNARFLGRLDYLSVSRVLGMADFAISPKISETEGNGKLFNYMACGLPTLVFDNPVNREILGEFGVYVRPQTAEAFADALSFCLNRDEQVRPLGAKLRERAAERASWEANQTVIRDAYARAQTRRKTRGGSTRG